MGNDRQAECARAEVRQYARGGVYWGAWLVYNLPLTVLALYAWSRDEVNGMLLAWTLLLALGLWQGLRGVRHCRALDRLLTQYERTDRDALTDRAATGMPP